MDPKPSHAGHDAIIGITNRQEALSRAYVSAIAAAAGYDVGETNLDMEGIDLSVHAGGHMRPRLDIQLKATTTLPPPANGVIRFELKVRNYDLLRVASMVPRILVVLDMPPDEIDWLTVAPYELVLRKCAFWKSLAGEDEVKNKESITISVDYDKRFDVDGLKKLMDQARTGRIS